MESTSKNKPLIIGHRGASALAPENTLASFQLAMDQGADGIELDVRLSRDRVPVVIHDATLKRTGSREESVAELTAIQLTKIDVGGWFNRRHPQLARGDYSRQTVPSLEEVLALFAKRAQRIYVELKTDSAEDSTFKLVQSVARLVAASREHVVVISFDLKAVAEIKRIQPVIRTGALFAPRRNPKAAIRKRRIVDDAVDCGADEILLHRLLCTSRTVQLATERGLRSVVWTVDDRKWLNRVKMLGIHALITDKPAAFTI